MAGEDRYEKRVLSLETSLSEIHRLLSLVQTRLIGGLETDKPGIINDLKNLQNRITLFEEDLAIVKQEYVKNATLANYVNDIAELKACLSEVKSESKTSISDIWKEIAKNNKFRWMILGGFTVINTGVLIWDILHR
jgi:hypothetical protein